jgi:hypothetical protein
MNMCLELGQLDIFFRLIRYEIFFRASQYGVKVAGSDRSVDARHHAVRNNRTRGRSCSACRCCLLPAAGRPNSQLSGRPASQLQREYVMASAYFILISLQSVLRIQTILMRIRIRPLKKTGSGSCRLYFSLICRLCFLP